MLNVTGEGYRGGCVAAVLWALTCLLAASPTARATETTDVYLAVYALGGFVEDRKASVAGLESISTNIRSGVGAGLRVGIFPDLTKRMVGVEVEYFGTFHQMSFVLPANGGVAQGSADFLVTNSMANLVIRRPTGALRPYAGIGIGYSAGHLHDATIPGRNSGHSDSTAAFAYQIMAGVQAEITKRLFLFAEYKRVAADFHWEGIAVDMRVNYCAVGLGLNF